MFGDTDVDPDGVDMEKAAQAFQQQYPDAPPEAAAFYADLMQLQARLDDIEKRRRQKAMKEALREELEARVEQTSERLDRVVKMTADTQQVETPMNGEDPERAEEREAIEAEQEVFTR